MAVGINTQLRLYFYMKILAEVYAMMISSRYRVSDVSVFTFAPIFAATELTGEPIQAFYGGWAAFLWPETSKESLSDDSLLTGRGKALVRGVMTI